MRKEEYTAMVKALLDNMEIVRGGPDSLISIGVRLVELRARGEVNHREEKDQTRQRQSHSTTACTPGWHRETCKAIAELVTVTSCS